MRVVFGSKKHWEAQTLVFFLLAWGAIMLLCGLAIDSGLLYLAKARLARAVDGAALAAVGNFDRSPVPATNRDLVATIVRNFAVANFTDLSLIGASGATQSGGNPNGTTGTSFTYNFNDGTQDPNHQYRRFVQVVFNTGTGGAITSATVNARCPVQTYFIGYATYAIGGNQNVKIGGYSGPTGLFDLKVSSSAVATRNPRLIMVVIDRSASMLEQNGGASGLPPAVVQFLDFFDTSSDSIGIVSFGTAARLEMPMTTNFIIAGTNNLIDAYETNSLGGAEPGLDPESRTGDATYDPNYASTGVRRLKFGGSTAADDGIRLALEQLMANSGFSDPDVVKYMVIFTDGRWNTCRTLFAAPGYTNEVTVPTLGQFVSNTIAEGLPLGNVPGPWVATTNLLEDSNILPMPTLSPMPYLTHAIAAGLDHYANLAPDHLNDTWQSADGVNEPLGSPAVSVGAPLFVATNSWVGTNALGIDVFTHDFDVWLQPGAVAYYYANGLAVLTGTYLAFVSDYTNPTKHINLYVGLGGKVDLVVPGYIVDGTAFDGLDEAYPDGTAFNPPENTYPRYRIDNYQQAFMWEDDTVAPANPAAYPPSAPFWSDSLERQLMFRNYVNLLTGFYVSRPNYPLGAGYEPLITEDNPPGAPRAVDPLGPYYPGAAFYWPFGGALDSSGNVTGADGVSWESTYALVNPNSDPTAAAGYTGQARHNAYSINMLATNAAPSWAGELFYKSTSSGGTNTIAGTGSTPASQIMVSSDWKNGAPPFVTVLGGITGLMTNEPTHDTNILPNPSVWRPLSFNGVGAALSGVGGVTPTGSATGGYVSDGTGGHIYANAMAYSGRPTHYYDFSKGSWEPIGDNHSTNQQFLQLGNWKAEEYAWHARALGVTIYTVGYGTAVSQAQQVFLAQIANSTNTTAGGGTNIPFNASQPIGQQFYATNAAQISNDFYSVGQAINAALTQ